MIYITYFLSKKNSQSFIQLLLFSRNLFMYLSIFIFFYFLCNTAATAAAAAKSLQLYLTLCNPIDGSPSGSSVPGILQVRTREWVAISFSNARKWKVKGKLLSHVLFLATPRTAAYQAPPSIYYMHLISILISCFSLVSLLFSLLFYNEKRGARNFTLDIICLYSRNLIYYFLHCFLSKLLFQI